MPQELAQGDGAFAPERSLPDDHLTILLLGACAMRCKTCFGPEYEITGSVTAEDWINSVSDYWVPRRGIRELTISGGEPLLWRDRTGADLEDLMVGMREENPGLGITLSTIGRGRKRDKLIGRVGIIQSATTIGLPLYGDTAEAHGAHQLTAQGNPNLQGWHDVVEFLDASPDFPREDPLRIEIRSVLTQPNFQPLLGLPVLMRRWDRIEKLDWCLYEPNFLTGPVRQAYRDEATLPLEGAGSFRDFVEQVCGPVDFDPTQKHCRYPLRGLEARDLIPYPVQGVTGKYIFASPDGRVTIEGQDKEVPNLFSPIFPVGHIRRPEELDEGFERYADFPRS